MQRPKKDFRQIGALLVEAGYITQPQLQSAIEAQKRTKRRLGETLVDLGFVSELGIALALSTQLGIPFIDFETAVVDPQAIELIPEKLCEKHGIFPLNLERGTLTVVMADPLNFDALKDIGFAIDRNFEPAVSTATEIKKAIKRYYHLSGPVHEILEKMGAGPVEVLPGHVEPSEVEEAGKSDSPPIIKMVNNIISGAVKERASDVHIEPRKKSVAIRERVDGLLTDVLELPKWVQGSVTSRVKILSGLDIAEKRIPQDGRIKVRMEGREVDLRVSTLPIQYGESIVIRILDTSTSIPELAGIGLSEEGLKRAKAMVSKPQGLVLVTGPTGSGKTSTLYAMINEVRKPSINIVSLEDPVEFELADVKQVSINEKTGLTFAYGLRSVLRQDPDVIMVGEMRDQETAQIAMQSSLTGHLVLSTLHTNTAAAAVTRLRNMGVQPYLIAS
jgi:type IV pilus assembly protein PilB